MGVQYVEMFQVIVREIWTIFVVAKSMMWAVFCWLVNGAGAV